MPDNVCVSIRAEWDIVTARKEGRIMAVALGFSTTEQALIATAISEVARNILEHASTGEIHLEVLRRGAESGMEIVAVDEGPGIPDISLALRDGYSTKGSLGLGLPGARRLMDELEIASQVGKGTQVTMRKWKR